jgi:RNA polymerase sigma factor for flagellar operon FliA
MHLSAVERDAIIEDHMPFARAIAHNTWKRTPPHVDKSDVEQDAMVGLIEAASAFDAERGYSFKTFASYRIKGAVHDGLRRRDHLKRGWRERCEAIELVRDRLTIDLGREATIDDLSEATGLDCARIRRTLHLAKTAVYSLDDIPEDKDSPLLAWLSSGDNVEQSVIDRAAHEEFLTMVERLPRQERLVIEAYLQNRRLAAADELGVCESRISQIKTRAIERLRTMFNAA